MRSWNRLIGMDRRRMGSMRWRPAVDTLEERLVLSPTVVDTNQPATFDTSQVWQIPDVATSPDGSHSVAVFQSSPYSGPTNGDVFYQLLNTNGSPYGSPVEVNTYTPGSQGNPKVAMDAQGDFVVVWSGFDSGGSGPSPGGGGSNPNIMGQLYNASGVAQGPNIVLGSLGVNYIYDSLSVAMAPNGDFALAYLTFQNGPSENVTAALFNSSGGPIVSNFIANSSSQFNCTSPSVAIDSNDNFVVAYTANPNNPIMELGDPAPPSQVYVNFYNAGGTPVWATQVTTATSSDAITESAVAMNNSDQVAVTWLDQTSSNPKAVYAATLDGTNGGANVSGQVLVYQDTTGATTPTLPAVAIDSSGEFVVTWEQDNTNSPGAGVIYAAGLDYAGTFLFTPIQVNNPIDDGYDAAPEIAMTSSGQFIIIYQMYDSAESPDTIFDKIYHI